MLAKPLKPPVPDATEPLPTEGRPGGLDGLVQQFQNALGILSRPDVEMTTGAANPMGVVKGTRFIGSDILKKIAESSWGSRAGTRMPGEFVRIGEGSQGTVFKVPDHVMEFFDIPGQMTVKRGGFSLLKEGDALADMASRGNQSMQKPYVGTVLETGVERSDLLDNMDPITAYRRGLLSVDDVIRTYLFTRYVPMSNNARIQPDRLKALANEATRRGLRIADFSFPDNVHYIDGGPVVMDAGYWYRPMTTPVKELHRTNWQTVRGNAPQPPKVRK